MKVCESCRARFKGDAKVCPLDGRALLELPDPLIGRSIWRLLLIALGPFLEPLGKIVIHVLRQKGLQPFSRALENDA